MMCHKTLSCRSALRTRGQCRGRSRAPRCADAYSCNVDVAVLDAEQESRAKSEAVGSEGEAAEGTLVAVDESGEGEEVAGGEGVGGVDEEGGDRGGVDGNNSHATLHDPSY